MADGRLRVIGVPPSGHGLKTALTRHVKEGTVVTALDDAKLRALTQLVATDLDVEYASIGELVGRFLTMLGEPIARLCPRGQLAATVGIVCRDLPSGSPFASSARFSGTADLIVERLGELRDWGLTSDELSAVIERASPGLAAKLESFVFIDDSVREVMEETNRQFAADRVLRSLQIQPDRDVPVRRVVAAVGDAEKPVYEKWLRWLTGFGIEVVVLVDFVPGHGQLFASSSRCSQRLGVPIEAGKDALPWYAALFSEDTTGNAPRIEVVSTADPLSEAEWAVRGCLHQISDGAMPHRIGIFARDAETYAPLLQSAALRLGVPVTANVTTPLLTNGFAALTLECLEVLAGDDVRALGRLARSSYLRAGVENTAALHTAAREAYRQGTGQWRAITEWAGEQGEEFGWLRHLLDWRERSSVSRTSLGGWLNRLRELVGGTQIVDFAVAQDADTRTRDTRAQTVLQRSVSDTAYIYDRGDRPELGLASFVQLARSLWENETVVVEGRPNGVRLVSDTASLTEHDTLFVVGMLEGTLPRRRAEDPLFFDSEREEQSTLLPGIKLPNSYDKAAAERDEFVRICAAASKRLVFSFPETDDTKDNVPAFYLEELERACPGKVERSVRPRSHFVPPIAECRATPDERIRQALDGPREAPEPPVITTKLAQDVVRPDFNKGVSPEELARALVCPFQSSMRYRMRLIAPARRRLMRSLRELPTIAKLATGGDREEVERLMSQAIDDYLQDIYPEFEPWELAMLKAAAERLADEWVEREFRSRALWHEEGEKTVVDVALDHKGLRSEIKVGGKKLRLTGGAASMTQRKNYSVLRFFDSSTPALTEVAEVPEDNEDAFLYGLYLMTQLGLPQRNPTVEVDGMDGKRILAGFKNIRSFAPHDPKNGLEVVRISDSRDVFFQNVVNRLRGAVEVLERSDMEARPGRHCEPCPYGELCRVSSVFGESNDPFAEEAE